MTILNWISIALTWLRRAFNAGREVQKIEDGVANPDGSPIGNPTTGVTDEKAGVTEGIETRGS